MNLNNQEALIWVGRQLFERNIVTGTTGNISYIKDDIMYITESGSCLGLIDSDSFAKVTLDGKIIEGNPSKEFPLHLAIYNINRDNKCVIHTHSFYTTFVSLIGNESYVKRELFAYTPYLEMMTKGNIEYVNYHKPGSVELFNEFKSKVKVDTDLYILKNHGSVATSNSVLKAFNLIEELEVCSKIVFNLENRYVINLNRIK